MSGYSDERLMELVEAVALLPPEQRGAWLAAECPGDTELIADVLDRAEGEDRMGSQYRPPNSLPRTSFPTGAGVPQTVTGAPQRASNSFLRDF